MTFLSLFLFFFIPNNSLDQSALSPLLFWISSRMKEKLDVLQLTKKKNLLRVDNLTWYFFFVPYRE